MLNIDNAKDLRDYVLGLIKNHPVGKNFIAKHTKLSRNIEQYDDVGQAYEAFDFKWVTKELVYNFSLSIQHKHDEYFEHFCDDANRNFDPTFIVSISGFHNWNVAPYFFSGQQLQLLQQQDSISFNDVEIKEGFFNLNLPTQYLKYFADCESSDSQNFIYHKKLTDFQMCDNELHLTQNFLNLLDHFLYFLCSIKNIEELADFLLTSQDTFVPKLEIFIQNPESTKFNKNVQFDIYKTLLFTGKYPEPCEKLKILFSNSPSKLDLTRFNNLLDIHAVLKPLRERRLTELDDKIE